jgi:hypothetical protein
MQNFSYRRLPRRKKKATPTQARQLLLPTVKKPHRGKQWKAARLAAERDFCEACGAFVHEQLGNGEVLRIHPPIDHIVPEAFLRLFCADADPHDPVNLMSLDGRCHGMKLAIEAKLFRGDALGFLQGLRELNWPMERVQAALKFYGLGR